MTTLFDRRRRRRSVTVLLIVAVLGHVCPTSGLVRTVWASGESHLQRARELFEAEEFERSLALVDSTLKATDNTKVRIRDGYILKARCLRRLGKVDDARTWFCKAVHLDPSWTPEPFEFYMEELAMFDEAKRECGKSQGGLSRWLWSHKLIAGAGIAVVGGLVYVLTLRKDGKPAPPQLGEFPPPPAR